MLLKTDQAIFNWRGLTNKVDTLCPCSWLHQNSDSLRVQSRTGQKEIVGKLYIAEVSLVEFEFKLAEH